MCEGTYIHAKKYQIRKKFSCERNGRHLGRAALAGKQNGGLSTRPSTLRNAPQDRKPAVVSQGIHMYQHQLSKPKVGFYELRFSYPRLGNDVVVMVQVVEGDPFRLAVELPPSRESSNTNQLQDQPRLELLDVADNHVTAPDAREWGKLEARAAAVPRPPFEGDARAAAGTLLYTKPLGERVTWPTYKNGFFTFGDIGFVAKYGVAYVLRFTVYNVSGGSERVVRIQPVDSREIKAVDCDANQYYIPLEAACYNCMEGGRCTGGSIYDLEV